MKKKHNAAALAGVLGASFLFAMLSSAAPVDGASIRLRNAVIDTSPAARQARSGLFKPQDKVAADSGSMFVQSDDPDARRLFIIQFAGPVRQLWKEAVEQTGARLGGYLPENAFIAELTRAQLGLVAELECVRWIGAFQPDYKIDHGLGRRFALARQTGGTAGAAIENFTIQTFSAETVSVVRDVILAKNCRVFSVAAAGRRGLIRARMPVATAAELIALPEVEFIEIYVAPRLHNNIATDDEHMNVRNLWTNSNLTGAGQIVAVADTGLDTGDADTIHPDFSNRIVAAFALGRPESNDWSDATSHGGHGTHVAGSVLGSGVAWSNGLFRGAAYEASLVFQSVMDNAGRLGGLPDVLTNLFYQAYTNGARLHNNSWGSSVAGRYDAESQYADQFMWDVRDMLVVFSSGNEGIDADRDGVIDPSSVGSPGTAKNVLTVGASETDRPSGSGGYSAEIYGDVWPRDYPVDPIRGDLISTAFETHQGMAAFSSRGPCLDGRFKPDIAAPGTDIVSCRSRMPGASIAWGTGVGVLGNAASNFYVFSGGTSMSAPLTTGAAALMRQCLQQHCGFASPSAALMKAILLNGARSLSPGQYGAGRYREIPNARPNNVEGWGQVDMDNTLFPGGDKTNVYYDVTNAAGALVTGAAKIYSFALSGTNTVNITLCWSDYPATLAAAKQLVNDLDLTVKTPDGVTHYPNGLAEADRINNVESVDAACAVTGTVQITVRGHNVPNGPQPYALVIRGEGAPSKTQAYADPAVVIGGNWYVWFYSSGYQMSGPYNFGVSGVPVAGDFDNDGSADPAVTVGPWWYICFSSLGYQLGDGPFNFGVSGVPVAGDFDNDRFADPAVVVNSLWYIWFSSLKYQLGDGPFDFGVSGLPVAADFDNDGSADPAVVSANGGLWYIYFSSAGYQLAGGPFDFGVSGVPVAGDFDGDGSADPAVVSANGGLWYIYFSSAGYQLAGGPFNLGMTGTPVAGDFDGQ
ncbi:MAG: S8 family serine peptidase [Kiritimatiellae bacterium]|nr:S8 family serine peptidase [Kiritimatiellia bacterium]